MRATQAVSNVTILAWCTPAAGQRISDFITPQPFSGGGVLIAGILSRVPAPIDPRVGTGVEQLILDGVPQ
jgi:hypothetical protein